jgi:hypothetical protein
MFHGEIVTLSIFSGIIVLGIILMILSFFLPALDLYRQPTVAAAAAMLM